MNENENKKNEMQKRIKNDFKFLPNSTYWIAATTQLANVETKPKVLKNTPTLMKNGAYFINAGYKTMDEYLDKNPNNFPANEIYNVFEQITQPTGKPLYFLRYSGNPGRSINSSSSMNGFDVDLDAETKTYNQEKSTNAKILELTEKLAEANYNIRTKESECESLKRENQLKDTEIESLRQKLTSNSSTEITTGLVQFYKEECERLRREVSELKKLYDEAQQTVINERAKSTENSIKIAALEKDKENLEEKLMELEGELDETTQTLNGLEQDNNKGIFDRVQEIAMSNPALATEVVNNGTVIMKGLFDLVNRFLPNGGEPLALVQAKDLPRNNPELQNQFASPQPMAQPTNYANEQLAAPASAPAPMPIPQPNNNNVATQKPTLHFSQQNGMANHGR